MRDDARRRGTGRINPSLITRAHDRSAQDKATRAKDGAVERREGSLGRFHFRYSAAPLMIPLIYLACAALVGILALTETAEPGEVERT